MFSLASPVGQFVRLPASLRLMLLSLPERCPWRAKFLRVTLELITERVRVWWKKKSYICFLKLHQLKDNWPPAEVLNVKYYINNPSWWKSLSSPSFTFSIFSKCVLWTDSLEFGLLVTPPTKSAVPPWLMSPPLVKVCHTHRNLKCCTMFLCLQTLR